jgi:catechol 2,3-dioxygenase-like lactoylglutathione lyase family enzyme
VPNDPTTFISGIDHVAVPTESPRRLIEFYQRLGFELVAVRDHPLGGDEPRSASLALGDIRINLHGPYVWRDGNPSLRAAGAAPGCLDICFVWGSTPSDAVALIHSAGAEVVSGPDERTGGRRNGSAIGRSVYTRDPDGNLLELIAYEA